jgi:hypothetical protein
MQSFTSCQKSIHALLRNENVLQHDHPPLKHSAKTPLKSRPSVEKNGPKSGFMNPPQFVFLWRTMEETSFWFTVNDCFPAIHQTLGFCWVDSAAAAIELEGLRAAGTAFAAIVVRALVLVGIMEERGEEEAKEQQQKEEEIEERGEALTLGGYSYPSLLVRERCENPLVYSLLMSPSTHPF